MAEEAPKAFEARKWATHSAVMTLESLSKTPPDDERLTEMRIDGGADRRTAWQVRGIALRSIVVEKGAQSVELDLPRPDAENAIVRAKVRAWAETGAARRRHSPAQAGSAAASIQSNSQAPASFWAIGSRGEALLQNEDELKRERIGIGLSAGTAEG